MLAWLKRLRILVCVLTCHLSIFTDNLDSIKVKYYSHKKHLDIAKGKLPGKEILYIFNMPTYRSLLWRAHRCHSDSLSHHHKASAGERRRGSPNNWTCLLHRSLNLKKQYVSLECVLTDLFKVMGNDWVSFFYIKIKLKEDFVLRSMKNLLAKTVLYTVQFLQSTISSALSIFSASSFSARKK